MSPIYLESKKMTWIKESENTSNRIKRTQCSSRCLRSSLNTWSAIIATDLDMQIQGFRTPNECVRIKSKMHAHITCEHTIKEIYKIRLK